MAVGDRRQCLDSMWNPNIWIQCGIQTLLRPHFAKTERLSGAKTGTEKVHWGGVEGVSIVHHLCGGAVRVARCHVVWVVDYRDIFLFTFFS